MVYKKAEKRAQRGTDIEKAGHKAFGRIKTGMEQNSARAEEPDKIFGKIGQNKQQKARPVSFYLSRANPHKL
ncbi:MAG: hypothetical protein Q4G07_06620 [Oscillospiraceae bacterium]|nr:hypothetical protein [Oscillospiraceae bacterium]